MSLVVFALSLVGSLDAALERHAVLQAKGLLNAAEAYALNPANAQSRHPGTVADLVKPPFGGASLLKDKERDLTDPWGGIYRCRTDADERGDVRFYVWTERFVNGKVRKIGYPPPEKK